MAVIVGLPGSGKTTLAKSLSTRMQAPYHTCGDVIRGWVKARGLPLTPANDIKASRYFAARPGVLAQQVAAKVNSSSAPVQIVDGLRSVADLKELRRHFDVKVIAMTVPKAERYRRLIARKRFDNVNADYLQKRDRREVGLGLLHLLRHPFKRVDNSGSLQAVGGIARELAKDLRR